MVKCTTCEKAAHSRSNVSHSHGRSNRIREVNIGSVKVKMEGGMRRMYIYTSCLRSNFVERA